MSVKTIRNIILFKLCLLAALALSYKKILFFGDLPLSAAKEDGALETTETEATPKADEEVSAEAKTRRSFMANLLDLPKLDPTPRKKEELGKYLSLAERKQQQVEERVNILQKKEEQLQRLEKSIDDKLLKLDEERKFLAQTIQQEKDLQGQRLTKLIELYDKMEPKKAAPVFEKMDKDLVVALFKSLKQKQVTTILENMNPDKSVALSEYFGRVRSAREYELLKELNTSLRKEFQECKGMPADLPKDPEPQNAAVPAVAPATTTPPTAANVPAPSAPSESPAPVVSPAVSPAAEAPKAT